MGQTGATDVIAYNLSTESKVVSIAIADADGEVEHTSRTIEIDPNEKVDPVNRGKIPLNTDYTVEVSVEDGPSETLEWNDPDVRQAPLWIVVDDSRNIKFLLQVG